MPTLSRGDVDLYYECHGSGAPLLLVAGLASDSQRRQRVIAWFRNLFYWIFSPRFFDDEKTVDDAVRFAIDYPYPQSAKSFRNQVAALSTFDSTSGLSRLRAPTLVLAGTDDLLFPIGACRAFGERIHGSTFAAIDGAAHSLHVEASQRFAECVAGFLLERR